MRMRFSVAALCLAAAACGPSPKEECGDFEQTACARLAPCLSVTPTECLRTLDGELRCAQVVAVDGDLDRCTTDTGKLACSDLDGGVQLAPSCDAVRFRSR